MNTEGYGGNTGTLVLQDLINERRLSRFQVVTFLLCFSILVLDGYDTVVVGYIAPALKAHFGAAPAQLAPMFGAGLFGLTLGSFIFGPVADRFGRKPTLIASIAVFALFSLLSARADSIGMSMSPTLQDCLRSKGSRYEVVRHPYSHSSIETAAAAHIPGDRLAKTVLLEDEHGYVAAVLPSTYAVQLSELWSKTGRRLALATEVELRELFKDCDVGALPPICMAYGMPEHEPQVGHALRSTSATSASLIFGSAALIIASIRSIFAITWPSVGDLTLPASIGPPDTNTTGMFRRIAAISMLSCAHSPSTPGNSVNGLLDANRMRSLRRRGRSSGSVVNALFDRSSTSSVSARSKISRGNSLRPHASLSSRAPASRPARSCSKVVVTVVGKKIGQRPQRVVPKLSILLSQRPSGVLCGTVT